MKKTNTPAASAMLALDPVERDFLDALARLKAGKPKHERLVAAARAGQLRVNVSTVALEAGHSRTLIGHKGCKYPSVRDQIAALKTDPENPTRMQDIVAARRQDVARLKRELALSQSQNAALVVRNIKLEQEVQRQKRATERQGKRAAAPGNNVRTLRD